MPLSGSQIEDQGLRTIDDCTILHTKVAILQTSVMSISTESKRKSISCCSRIAKLWLLSLFEGLGVAALTFVYSFFTSYDTRYGILVYALAYGLFIAILAPTTGGHLNPAVTITLLISGIFGTDRARRLRDKGIIFTQSIMYIVFQIAGGIGGFIFADWFKGVSSADGLKQYFDILEESEGKYIKICFAEAIGTALICFTVTCLVYRQAGGDVGPLLVGLALFVAGETVGKHSGAQFNPAITAGTITGAIIFMSSNEYKGIPPGYDKPRAALATEFLMCWIGCQLIGSLVAWLLNIIVQLAKRRHESIGTIQMDIQASSSDFSETKARSPVIEALTESV